MYSDNSSDVVSAHKPFSIQLVLNGRESLNSKDHDILNDKHKLGDLGQSVILEGSKFPASDISRITLHVVYECKDGTQYRDVFTLIDE